MADTNNPAFVRGAQDMLPEQAPPAANDGLIGWIRTKLFGTVTDSFVTIFFGLIFIILAWQATSFLLLRANTHGVSQGEGTLARTLTELDAKLWQATDLQNNADTTVEALIVDLEAEMADLIRRIEALDLDSLEVVERIRHERRVLPAAVSDRMDIAASKLPLSMAVELAIVRRELMDLNVTQTPDLSGLMIGDAEKQTLRQASQPWVRFDEAQKDLYGQTNSAITRLLSATETTDEGKIFRPLADIIPEIEALLAGLQLDGAPIEPSQILLKPTRPALQFTGLVDSVAMTPINNLPSSRLLKIRKDYFSAENADNLKDYRSELATSMALEENPELSGRALTRRSEAIEAEVLTDAVLFLQPNAPAFSNRIEPLPQSLLDVLGEMDFWPAARAFVDQDLRDGDQPLDQQSNQEKIAIAQRAFEGENPISGPFADATQDLLSAYASQDLAGMQSALDGFAPLVNWAASRDGANWAVINNGVGADKRSNWNRMLIGTYTEQRVWHLFDPDAETLKLNDKVWRIWLVLLGLIIAVLPLFVPRARSRMFIAWTIAYPLFLLLMLGGLAVRVSGFSWGDYYGSETFDAGVSNYYDALEAQSDARPLLSQSNANNLLSSVQIVDAYSRDVSGIEETLTTLVSAPERFDLTPPAALAEIRASTPEPTRDFLFLNLPYADFVEAQEYRAFVSSLNAATRALGRADVGEAAAFISDIDASLSGAKSRFYAFSQRGAVIQALIALAIVALAIGARRIRGFGETAGPALTVTTILAAFYAVIMLWGTVINPAAAHRGIIKDNKIVGFLTADNAFVDDISPQIIQDQIDALKAEAAAEGVDPAVAQALTAQVFALGPSLRGAESGLASYINAVDQGNGTLVVLPHVPSKLWGGLLVTMILGLVGMAASLPIGIVLAFGRQSTLPIVRWFCTGLIEGVRGVPLIALLLIVTFVLPKLLPPGAEYPALALVLGAICLFGGVYQAEVIRGGLQSLPKGQYEAAQAMGLSFWQESRLISLPQALKAVIPAIVNTFIGLFKDTTLVIVVGIFDLLTVVEFQITAENAWNRTKPEALLVVALIFFVLMFSLSRYSIWLEKRLATDHR